MNPATLSPEVRALFPDGVAAAELRVPGDVSLLLPAEADCLGRAVQKRAEEFAAGRLCARRALREFGFADFALRVADDRQPIWPPSMVGSITHTEGYCAAAVGERRHWLGIGIDSEMLAPLRAGFAARICVAAESAWVESLPVSEREAAILLIFSAKEAFYKCQFPMVGEKLRFRDLYVECLAWGSSQPQFRVHATRAIALAQRARLPVPGRYRFHERFVSTAIAIEA